MSPNSTDPAEPQELTAEQVVDYLRQHPDFLAHHPYTPGAISLIYEVVVYDPARPCVLETPFLLNVSMEVSDRMLTTDTISARL